MRLGSTFASVGIAGRVEQEIREDRGASCQQRAMGASTLRNDVIGYEDVVDADERPVSRKAGRAIGSGRNAAASWHGAPVPRQRIEIPRSRIGGRWREAPLASGSTSRELCRPRAQVATARSLRVRQGLGAPDCPDQDRHANSESMDNALSRPRRRPVVDDDRSSMRHQRSPLQRQCIGRNRITQPATLIRESLFLLASSTLRFRASGTLR